MGAFSVDRAVRTVGVAVAAVDARAVADSGFIFIIRFGYTRDHLGSFVRNHDDQVHRTDIGAVFAADAFIRINLGASIDNLDRAVSTDFGAVSLAGAACGADAQRLGVKVGSVFAACRSRCLVCFLIFCSVASDKGYFLFQFRQIVEGIYDDLFLAFYGAGHTADTLVVVDDRVVVDDVNSTLWTGSDAVAAARCV